MSSEEKNPNSYKNKKINKSLNVNISSPKNNKEEEKSDNNQLIRPIPIPINPIIINHQKSEVTTQPNSSVTINNKNSDSNIPIIYPKYQIPYLPQQNFSFEDNNKCNFIQSTNSQNEEKAEKNNNLSFQKDKLCCCCTKTKCLKKYCECFANNKFCKDCKCKDCLNKFELNNYDINKYINENEIIICTCTKSNCNKKYCECYKSGVKCNEKCRCLNCMNMNNKKQNIINNSTINNENSNKNNEKEKEKYINVDEKKPNSRKSSFSEDFIDKFKIQRISVFINKNQTMINVDKFSKEEMNLLSKKRRMVRK